MRDARLYINEIMVEFTETPSILFNYIVTDATDPSAVVNDYSKEVSIPATPSNNALFNEVWRLDRRQGSASFNPNRRTPFAYYVDAALYQRGYCKLTAVETDKSGAMSYKVTLFGGLGSFFYSLKYSDTEGLSARTLADLNFTNGPGQGTNLSFEITAENVYTAWQSLGVDFRISEKWSILNFAPAYNGLPDNLDSSKVLINTTNIEHLFPQVGAGGEYDTYEGYAMGEAAEELTEWEVYDLRSYLQRPVIRVRALLEAICNPNNNGGYAVTLDPNFFTRTNPYYQDAWMTLPLITSGEKQRSSTSVAATITKRGEDGYALEYTAKIVPDNVEVTLSFQRSTTSGTAFTTSVNQWDQVEAGIGQAVQEQVVCGGFLVQLIAYTNDIIVGYSDVHYFQSEMGGNPYTNGGASLFLEKFAAAAPACNITKTIQHIGGHWEGATWVDESGKTVSVSLSLNANVTYDSLILKFCPMMSLWQLGNVLGDSEEYGIYTDTYFDAYNVTSQGKIGRGAPPDMSAALGTDRVINDVDSFAVANNMINLTISEESEFLTGRTITKEMLLSTDYSPCEWLLAYCKQFGLMFRYNPTATDIETGAINGTIEILMRGAYFRTSEVVDLSASIDRSKAMNLTPQGMAESRYYLFKANQGEGEAAAEYEAKYGREYGAKVVTTPYRFAFAEQDILDSDIFKGAVDVLEKDKYFTGYLDDLPYYVWNGFRYSLFKEVTTEDAEAEEYKMRNRLSSKVPINALGLANYDQFPKVQFHGADNSAVDGANVLVFYKGNFGLYAPLMLTDDLPVMSLLNAGAPCWLLTRSTYDYNGDEVAIELAELPVFCRCPTDTSGAVVASWDFGAPKELYLPLTTINDNVTLFHFWKDYLADYFHEDARKLTAYVRLSGQVSDEWLRRLYWFDNALWRLNAISEYDAMSEESTKCEFLKVQDAASLKSKSYPFLTLSKTSITIGASGGMVQVGATGTGIEKLKVTRGVGAFFVTNINTRVIEDGSVYTIVLTVSENTSGFRRFGYINITWNTQITTLIVNQRG